MAEDQEAKIRERAYRIWEEAGMPEGRQDEHWLQAEMEIGEMEDMPVPKTADAPPNKKG